VIVNVNTIVCLPSLEKHSFRVPYQAHSQERAEKRIECQAKTRPPVRHTGIVDEKVMDEIKNAVPNKGSDY
jgi:ribosomal protein S25